MMRPAKASEARRAPNTTRRARGASGADGISSRPFAPPVARPHLLPFIVSSIPTTDTLVSLRSLTLDTVYPSASSCVTNPSSDRVRRPDVTRREDCGTIESSKPMDTRLAEAEKRTDFEAVRSSEASKGCSWEGGEEEEVEEGSTAPSGDKEES